MAFPAPSVTPPTFSTLPAAYFQGITFDGNGPFFMRGDGGLDGIFMPDVRNGDLPAPRTHGQYIGLDLLSGRDITLTIDIGPPFGAYGTLEGAQAALRTALTPSGTTENPLFLQLPNGTQLVSMVRPRKREGKIDIVYVLGSLAQNIPVQFHATDPTIYAAGTLDPSVGVPTPLGGFAFPLTFPISFGGGTEFGAITATNSGDMTCYPIITFTGPCTYPTLTNASLSGNPFIQFAVTMLAGDQLIVNTDPKYPSAIYFTAGSTVGSSFMYTLTQSSAWWALAPGVNNLQFTTLDTTTVAGFVNVEYTSAYSAAA